MSIFGAFSIGMILGINLGLLSVVVILKVIERKTKKKS